MEDLRGAAGGGGAVYKKKYIKESFICFISPFSPRRMNLRLHDVE